MKRNMIYSNEYSTPYVEIILCDADSLLCQSPSGTEEFGRDDNSEGWFNK